MRLCVGFFFLVVPIAFSAQNKRDVYKSYLKYEQKKRNFRKNQKEFLKLRKRDLREEKKLESEKNKAYLLDFLSNIQTVQPAKILKRPSQIKKLSKQEKAFLAYQKRQRDFSQQRKRAFLAYKKKYEESKKKQNKILALRLKNISALRDSAEEDKIPVF